MHFNINITVIKLVHEMLGSTENMLRYVIPRVALLQYLSRWHYGFQERVCFLGKLSAAGEVVFLDYSFH